MVEVFLEPLPKLKYSLKNLNSDKTENLYVTLKYYRTNSFYGNLKQITNLRGNAQKC